MKLGDVIREYREIHGMSQRTFARKCGLSNVQIAFLERGYGSNGKPFEPTFETIRTARSHRIAVKRRRIAYFAFFCFGSRIMLLG